MPIPQDEETLQDHFEEFYEDIFEELTEIGGELEQLRVCENLSDHLAGNVYAKFREEEDAEKALHKLVVRAASPTAHFHISLSRPLSSRATPCRLAPRGIPAAPPSIPATNHPACPRPPSPGRIRPFCSGR